MALPVKTQVMNAITERLESISLLKQVLYEKSKPQARDTVDFPVCFVFDDEESLTQYRGRLRHVSFPCWVEIHAEETGLAENETNRKHLSDQLDNLQAEVYNVLIKSRGTDLENLGVRITEPSSTNSRKVYQSEVFGALIMVFNVLYMTNHKSLYTVNIASQANLNP